MYSGKDLLIIDNFNYGLESIEDIEQKEIWRKILSLNCDLIITTRCIQEAFSNHQIYVEELDYEILSKIYANYCHYDEDQSDAVRKIVSAVNGHTLVAELIAKQANASHKTLQKCTNY